MAWFVIATVGTVGSSGVATASVQQFADAAAYARTVGAGPQQVDPGQPGSGYATRAEAQAEADRYNKQPASQRQAGGTPPPPSNPLAGLEGLAKILGDFFTALTDGKIWRSLGWIVLGIALMLAGVLWWIGPSAARRSPAGIAAGAGRRLAT